MGIFNFSDQLDYILTKSIFIRPGISRIIDAPIYRTPQMFDEGAI